MRILETFWVKLNMSQVSILYHGILTGTKVQQTLKCCNLLKKCPILPRKIVN